MQEDRDTQYEALSQTWLELLGKHSSTLPAGDSSIPALNSDPWNSLEHVQGVKTVDLQRVHLPISDADVEQLLHIMQEQSGSHPEL